MAELTNIGGVEITVDMLDVTSHDSATIFKEVIAGLADAGEVSIEGNFDSTDTNGQIAMVTDAKAGTSRTAVVTFPSSIATWTFTGLISKIKVGDAPVDGKIPFTASIKISGSPTLATTASNNITALTVTTATLYPSFVQGTYTYAGVSTGNTCTIAATFAAGTCAMYVNDVLQENLTTTQASGAVDLGDDGDLTVIKLVVTETGKTPKTYTINMANAAA